MGRACDRHAAILAGALALLAAGCHQYLDPRLYGQVREPPPDATSGTVQVRFLGVGGFIIQREHDIVLTAPFYTNPSEGFLFGSRRVRPNQNLIDCLLHERWASKASAILVGHTHYDHFMDVPYIASAIAKNAILYGSLTMKQLAMAPPYQLDAQRIVVVSDVAGQDRVDYRKCSSKPKEACVQGSGAGDWIPVNEGVRIRALCSRHAGPRAWTGCLTHVPPEPTRVKDWKLGDTYAYLIDFLDRTTGKPVFRVYYQDTATPPTYGYVAEALVQDKSVDVALLCGAGFSVVHDNPRGIVRNTKPRYVVFGHWESFFRPQTKPLETLAYFDYSDLVARMKRLAQPEPAGISWPGQFWVAAPGNLFVFEPGS